MNDLTLRTSTEVFVIINYLSKYKCKFSSLILTLFFLCLISENNLIAQCPTPCTNHSVTAHTSDFPLCTSGNTAELSGDVDNNSDCETTGGSDPGSNCFEFVIIRPSDAVMGFTSDIGKGNGCQGEADVFYTLIDGVCTEYPSSGSQNNFFFEYGVSDTMRIYICDNSSGQVSLCDLCSEVDCDLTCSASGTDESCTGGNDGEATATPIDGTAPFEYLWDDPGAQTTQTATGLSSGTYTVTVTDLNGCTSSCSVTITTGDGSPPTITCPADLTLECGVDLDENNNTDISDWLDSATGDDGGGGFTITNNYSSGNFSDDCGDTGTQTVTFTVTDDCGFTATCTADIIIEDNGDPSINCPADVTVECGDDTSSASTGVATGSDTCGDVTITESDSSTPGCGNTEVITRTWTATDDCGNTTTCVQTITVEDTGAPSINCPADVTVECGDDTSSASTGVATGSDTCGDVTITESDSSTPGCGNTEVITRTWTATDDCGNTTTCVQTITVEDTGVPSINCPADVTVECGDDTSSASTGVATGSDTCGDVSITEADSSTPGCGNTEVITRTWTATDDCGNTTTCVQTITVEDTGVPSINCPADVTVECGDDTSSASTGVATGSDTCGDVTITESDSSTPGCGNTEVITRTWTATDDCGNTTTCVQTITVEDTGVPSINCPADVTVECGDDTSSASTGVATGSDTCGDVSITEADSSTPGCGNTEVITRTWTATDDCGNTTTCVQTITVEDTGVPSINCPSDVTVECGDDTSSASTGVATGSDTCGDVTITESDSSTPGCGNTEVITRTWTATDDCGNTSTCVQMITVEDTGVPSINCPSDVTVECGDDTSSASTGVATGSDTCGDVTITESDSSTPGCGNTEVITRTWTATDDCGNTSTCVQTITVEDTGVPSINCPSDVTVECGDDTSSASTGVATGSDTCGDVTITESDSSTPGCGNTEVITRTWTATDDCGNTSTCVQTITVEDTGVPSINCPSDVTVECGDDTSSASTGVATGSNSCGGVTITESDSSTPGCGNTEVITRTWTATDDCGNTSTCVQTITVEDTEVPSINCPSDVTVECGDDTSSASTGVATGSDTCGDVTITESDSSVPGCGNTEVITRTWTVTDDCGNTTTCNQIITVVDSTPPSIDVNASDDSVECDGSDDPGGAFAAWLANNGGASASDICGGVSWSNDSGGLSNGCGETGSETVIFTATDDCGNTATTSATFTIEDNTPPSITCPGTLTLECGDDTNDDTNQEISDWLQSVTGNDDCGSLIFIENYEPGEFSNDCGSTGSQTVIFQVFDDCGNSASCTAEVVIEDNTPPSIVCPDDVSIECSESTSPDNTGEATGSDLCGDVTITFNDDIQPNGCPDNEIIVRTWTATDECGNTATCNQTITTLVPEINLIKIVSEDPFYIGNGAYFLAYEIRVENTGDVVLNDVQVVDDMTLTFAAALDFNVNTYDIVVQPANTTLAINPLYNGGISDAELLDGNGSLLPGEFAVIEITMIVTPGDFLGPYLNTAIGTGITPNQVEVMDESDAETEAGPTEVEFPPLNELSDFVWHDINGDGIQQPDEPGLEGVVINLYDDMGNFIRDTITDSEGLYIFDELPDGDYYVEVVPPDGYEITFPNEGGDDDMDSDLDETNGPNTSALITLSNGQMINNLDIGLFVCVNIGELVWYDTNLDDVWNSEENGINGIAVNLYRNHAGSWILYDSQLTAHKPGTPSDDGYFKFCAPPGEYYLEIPIEPVYELVPVLPFQGTDPDIDSHFDDSNGPFTSPTFEFESGEGDCAINAGFYPMAMMGDYVWKDDNVNGIQDNGEDFASDVLVEAYDINDELIGSDMSDEHGKFIIDYLQKKEYYLKVYLPQGYGFTTPNQGDDDMDSDIDGTNGNSTTPFFLLDPGQELLNVDAGIVEGVVPLDLVDFDGENLKDHNYLFWKTSSEINTGVFEIERKTDQTLFEKTGSVKAQGYSSSLISYEFRDHDIEAGTRYYYRLKIIDLDGSFEYSGVIAIVTEASNEFKARIYPIPTMGQIHIELENAGVDAVQLNIYDVNSSAVIKSEDIDVDINAEIIAIERQLDWLTPGVYMMEVIAGNHKYREKVIIVK